jgi:hypothetical protein
MPDILIYQIISGSIDDRQNGSSFCLSFTAAYAAISHATSRRYFVSSESQSASKALKIYLCGFGLLM